LTLNKNQRILFFNGFIKGFLSGIIYGKNKDLIPEFEIMEQFIKSYNEFKTKKEIFINEEDHV